VLERITYDNEETDYTIARIAADADLPASRLGTDDLSPPRRNRRHPHRPDSTHQQAGDRSRQQHGNDLGGDHARHPQPRAGQFEDEQAQRRC
jgi:hypothetical protein